MKEKKSHGQLKIRQIAFFVLLKYNANPHFLKLAVVNSNKPMRKKLTKPSFFTASDLEVSSL